MKKQENKNKTKKIEMKRDLIITLADENYIEQAKQLFSSVYWNAGWKGDYMLLSHNIPEKHLKWFRKKGILIKKVKPIDKKDKGVIKHPPIVLDKIYLFSKELKKYKNIVFLDGDIIVRASLDALTKVNMLTAPKAADINLRMSFINSDKELYKKLEKTYELDTTSFNTGIIAFNTDIIKDNTLDEIKKLFKKFGKVNALAEESALNLYFYKKWNKLPMIYNLYPKSIIYKAHLKPEKIKSIIFHFVCTKKPWEKDSPFHKEYIYNLKRAEKINLKKPQKPRKIWTKKQIRKYVRYLKLRIFLFYLFIRIDEKIGKVGIFLKKINPRIYNKLKKIKIFHLFSAPHPDVS